MFGLVIFFLKNLVISESFVYDDITFSLIV